MPDIFDIVSGILINAVIGLIAYWNKSLTRGGCIAGILIGAIIYSTGGFTLWCILGSFFISSTIFDHIGKKKKAFLADMHEKGDRRDSWQVLANSGTAALCSAVFFLSREPILLVGYLSSLASSTADTWSSEIGVLSRRDPVSIIGFHRVPKGTSGGVSLTGSAVSVAGALFIPVIYVLIRQPTTDISPSGITLVHGALIASSGYLGSLADSILGATIQARYRCMQTGIITEKKLYRGNTTKLIAGFRAINNDAVNFLSNSIAAIVSMVLYYILFTR